MLVDFKVVNDVGSVEDDVNVVVVVVIVDAIGFLVVVLDVGSDETMVVMFFFCVDKLIGLFTLVVAFVVVELLIGFFVVVVVVVIGVVDGFLNNVIFTGFL